MVHITPFLDVFQVIKSWAGRDFSHMLMVETTDLPVPAGRQLPLDAGVALVAGRGIPGSNPKSLNLQVTGWVSRVMGVPHSWMGFLMENLEK